MNLEYYTRVFTPDIYPQLLEATADLSWLLSRGYTSTASIKLVGDRYQLSKSLREAVKRAGCSTMSSQSRAEREITSDLMAGATVWIDGFNLLITIERALRGDPVLICRDGVVRDIAGVHGTYRRGHNTIEAFELLSQVLRSLGVNRIKWFFDRPVSNSGKMAKIASSYGQADVVNDPDQDLINAPPEVVIISGDGIILERCTRWYNLGIIALTHEHMNLHQAGSLISNEGMMCAKTTHPVPWMIDLSKS